MKNIRIIELKLRNFGGIAQGIYTFDPALNELRGAQGTGKTSSYFAYMWVLGFNVPKWEPKIGVYRIHKIETQVIMKLAVDDMVYTIERISTPKYKVDKFTGAEDYHTQSSVFSIDGEKCKTQEVFKQEIEKIYGLPYQTIELLSSVDLFNTENNNWNSVTRRKFLFDLFDINKKTQELKDLPDFECIKEYLEKGKDEVSIKQVLNDEKNTINKELDFNNRYIQEKTSELAEYNDLDFEHIQAKKDEIKAELDKIKSVDYTKSDLLSEKIKELNDLKMELFNEQQKVYAQGQEKQHRIDELNSKLRTTLFEIDSINKNMENINEKLKELETKQKDVENETLDESATICPTCHQPLKEEEILKIVKKFNNSKTQRLQDIALNMSNLSVEAQNEQTRLNTQVNEKNALEAQLQALNEVDDIPSVNTKQNELQKKIGEVEKNIEEIKSKEITNEIKERENALQVQYDAFVAQLTAKNDIDKLKSQIESLKARNRELAIQDNERIRKVNALKKYIEEKVKLVNSEINKNFEKVSYVFFEFNSVTAQNEYKAICENVMNNTVYASMSSGEKIVANFYTSKSLRKILNANIPQFIDDVVISSVGKDIKDWQTIYFVTDPNYKVPVTLIKDVYTLQDCDVKKD